MSAPQRIPTWPAERLAYWYFRLNGFLTTENFVVHPDFGGDQRTDADLLAIRLAHRAENPVRPMQDDPRVASCTTFANVVIAEITVGACKLNGPWKDREAGNLQRVLQAIGCVNNAEAAEACSGIYERGAWTGKLATVRLFALGETRSELSIPDVQQLLWSDVIDFCVQRFSEYRREKQSVGQWTKEGRQLRKAALRGDAHARIRSMFRLRNEGAQMHAGA